VWQSNDSDSPPDFAARGARCSMQGIQEDGCLKFSLPIAVARDRRLWVNIARSSQRRRMPAMERQIGNGCLTVLDLCKFRNWFAAAGHFVFGSPSIKAFISRSTSVGLDLNM
jgi:hypothetical protein